MSWTHRALVMLGLCVALAAATTAGVVAAQPTPPTIEDQNDRLLRHLGAEQAAQEQAALELYRSYERMERDFAPPSSADSPGVQPAAPTGLATPSRGVDLLATLLLGLVGGVVGGAATLAGWMAATRRRLRQPASAT